jgi:hypothetical protein
MQLLMRRPEIVGFVSVAPPAHTEDFTFLAPCPTSGLIVHGGKDDVIPEQAVSEFVGRLHQQKGIKVDYRMMPHANHFFHDHIEIMIGHVHDHMNKLGHGGMPVPVSVATRAA